MQVSVIGPAPLRSPLYGAVEEIRPVRVTSASPPALVSTFFPTKMTRNPYVYAVHAVEPFERGVDVVIGQPAWAHTVPDAVRMATRIPTGRRRISSGPLPRAVAAAV
jgi:hypothetical protein